MTIWIYLFILAAECFIVFQLNRRDICSPDFLFTIGFFIAAIDLVVMKDVWDVELHWNTIAIICGGILLFSFGCSLSRFLITHGKGKTPETSPQIRNTSLDKISKARGWHYFFIIFNIVAIGIYALEVARAVRRTGRAGTFFYLLGKYSDVAKFTTENVAIPTIPSWLYHICIWDGYIWGIVLAYDYIKNKRLNKPLFLCFATAVLGCFIAGSRGDALSMIIGFAFIYLIQYREKKGRRQYGLKAFGWALGIGALVVFLFNIFVKVMSLNTGIDSIFEYMSVYAGAPTANLDYFLQSNYSRPEIWGTNTFYDMIRWIGDKTGNTNLVYVRNLPFRYSNGHGMGNVYTMFYSLILDFGIAGGLGFIFLAGAITEIFYLKACETTKTVSLGKLMYMYYVPLIAFAFFANKFYPALVTISTLYIIIIWSLTKLGLKYKIKLK